MNCESAVSALASRHEPFREIIERFGRILCAQIQVRAELGVMSLDGSTLSQERFLDGEPLIMSLKSEDFVSAFQQAASRVWPVATEVLPVLTEDLSRLAACLDDPQWALFAVRAMAYGEGEALQHAASKAGTGLEAAHLAFSLAWAPVIAAARELLADQAEDEQWRKSYCPICGADPDMGVLENHPDPSEFLVSKSGELWHHCPVCTHRWRFVRMVCPNCGNQDHDSLTKFSFPDVPREHVYACEKCQHYLPCLDLVESADKVDFNLAALGLVHLDAAAQAKGYTPLSPAPWAVGLTSEEQP